MESLYFLIPISLVILSVIVGLFLWSVKSGQFDDLEGPAYRILMDDAPPKKPSETTSEASQTSDDSGKTDTSKSDQADSADPKTR